MHNCKPGIKSIMLTALASLPALLLCLPSCLTREYAVTREYQETEFRTEYTAVQPTENVSVEYTDNTEYTLVPYYYWSSQDLYFKGFYNVWYYGYEMPGFEAGTGSRLKIYLQPQLQYEQMNLSVFDMTLPGHLDYPTPIGATGDSEKGQVAWSWITGSATSTWLDSANSRIGGARFLGGRSNLWQEPAAVQMVELDAGHARSVAVIVSGPFDKWNCSFTLGVVPVYHKIITRQVPGEQKTAQQVPYPATRQKTVYEFRQVPFWEVLFSR